MKIIRPNLKIFFLCSFLAPWQVLGFKIPGLSIIYLCFLVMLFDFKFWSQVLDYQFSRQSIVWFFGLMTLCLYSLTISSHPESVVVNFIMPSVFTIYVYFGIKSYGVNSYLLGITSSCIFAFFQWYEATFLSSQYLHVDKIISIFGNITFGIAQPTGSVAPSELSYSLFRVSGSTAEPSFFSQILLVSIPLFFRRPVLAMFLIIGILVSMSKITLFLGAFGIILYIFWKIRFGSFAVFLIITSIVYFLAGQALVKKFETKRAILDFHPSIYMRFLPSLFYKDLSFSNKVFGVGKYGACRVADKSWHQETETLTGYIDFEKQENCFLTNFSGVGSLWVDFGLIGVCALGGIFTFLPGSNLNSYREYFFRNKKSILFFWWFICFLNVYILTFVPSSYYFLGWLFSLDSYENRK